MRATKPLTDRVTCSYCGTTQAVQAVWLCVQCGAPYHVKEAAREILPFSNAFRLLLSSSPATNFAYPIIDFSKWQGDVNFGTLAASNAVKSIIKASQSTFIDSKFEQNKQGLIDHQLSFDVYHYFDPSYAVEQGALFFAGQVKALTAGWQKLDKRTYKTSYGAKFRAWMDIEDNIGPGGTALSPAQMASRVKQFADVFEAATGLIPGIYTRASFWDSCLTPCPWVIRHALWDAHYNTAIAGPTIPNDWKNNGQTWEIWQIDDKGLGVDGSYWGMGSHGIDVNYIHVTPQEAVSYAWAEEVTPPPEFTPYFVTTNTATLNIRYQPTDAGNEATISAKSNYGQSLKVIGMEQDSLGRNWLKLEAWAAEWLTKDQ